MVYICNLAKNKESKKDHTYSGRYMNANRVVGNNNVRRIKDNTITEFNISAKDEKRHSEDCPNICKIRNSLRFTDAIKELNSKLHSLDI
jgi:hypothetical protein